ncbi:MAG: bifunctional hydroxymethylpyrimidine kinase/phosphomethylpyrimidine kinase [SAR202 cluster bacterium Casp-Chloro-G4]|nr:bifunctional hydroxymethylpyrimidine kinase/phosphomethylpyrimidine kinase [Chloroflexota bacterium]PKB61654.1 MAG: bifunctional hydroxymethylpyrimidine kinase/phosphomethylpyrimidine kinase [SAR202 cluster bacterium Casp-Chloro-G4]
MTRIPTVMTIAGSDSGAGAGIQADLKTFAAHGVYGTSAITAITAQNTTGVTEVFELPTSLIASQIDAIVTDIGADVVKIGMLSSSDIIRVVAEKIKEHNLTNVVVDPVMIAKGGDRLLQEEAVDAMRRILLRMAFVITPNAPEAAVLVNRPVENLDDARWAAKELVIMGAKAAVVKGGHLDGPPTDILYDGNEFRAFTAQRIESTSTHGTGCTFASAIAANLAKGLPLREAVPAAKRYITNAIRNAAAVGHGHGPLNHFYMLKDEV